MGLLKNFGVVLFVLLFANELVAQKDSDYEVIYDIPTTSVKDQGSTGCCWAFSTTSFLESEILRMGGPTLDLSEMYTVYYAYEKKAKNYVYLHGKANFGQGGLAHDVLNIVDQYGFVPERKFYGRPDTTISHDHTELELSMKVLLDKYVFQDNARPSEIWFANLDGILQNYLGVLPTEIDYNKRTYSPIEFAKGLGFNRSNYIEITSYTHHPFYSTFDLEIPDNWAHGSYYNVPLDELMAIMKEALSKGYSFVWDGDVSDPFFSQSKALALVPKDAGKGFDDDEEQVVTQKARQYAFESWKTTDDHLMHVVGLVKDKDGKIYFKVKNSWGENSNDKGGYVYMTEAYFRMNTISIMLNKEALSKDQSKKVFGR